MAAAHFLYQPSSYRVGDSALIWCLLLHQLKELNVGHKACHFFTLQINCWKRSFFQVVQCPTCMLWIWPGTGSAQTLRRLGFIMLHDWSCLHHRKWVSSSTLQKHNWEREIWDPTWSTADDQKKAPKKKPIVKGARTGLVFHSLDRSCSAICLLSPISIYEPTMFIWA